MGLRRFIVRRLLLVVPIMIGVSLITFGLTKLAPSGPIEFAVGFNPNVGPEDVARLREQYGLNQPVWQQYIDWIARAIQGDFGQQIGTNREVSSILARRIPPTIALGLFGWAIALIVAIPTGVYAAVNKDSLGDNVSRFIALSGISTPNFWLGLMLILVFAVKLDVWSVIAPRKPLWHPEMLWYLILPGITLGTAASASLMRIMRSSMTEEINKEYVTAARAKGLPERTVILKHVLRNSLISVATVAAFLTANILAGAVVVETVFNWPGMGRQLVQAVIQRQINVIMAITLFVGLAEVVMNLFADIAYAALDPRISYD